MSRPQKSTTPATLAGQFWMIQIIAREARVLLNVQGIERDTDGNVYRFHSLATSLRNEAIRLRGLLNDALASVMTVPTCHNWSRNVTQH